LFLLVAGGLKFVRGHAAIQASIYGRIGNGVWHALLRLPFPGDGSDRYSRNWRILWSCCRPGLLGTERSTQDGMRRSRRCRGTIQ